VRTGDDPHLAAALLIFGLAAAEQVTLEDTAALSMAFPDLIDGLEGLGAAFYWREAA
jgi:5-enolpyruvylshikimate-3-phosphate synthase